MLIELFIVGAAVIVCDALAAGAGVVVAGAGTTFGAGRSFPPTIVTSTGAEAKPLAITRSDEGPFSTLPSIAKCKFDATFGPIEVLLKL